MRRTRPSGRSRRGRQRAIPTVAIAVPMAIMPRTGIEREWRAAHTDRDWRDYRSAVRHAFDRAMHVFEGGPDPDRRK